MSQGETIWVDSYVKDDGTLVKGYYRHQRTGDGPSPSSGTGRSGGGGRHSSHRQAGGQASPSRSDWSSLSGDWRNGAESAKAPKGGIDHRELTDGVAARISGDSLRLDIRLPQDAPAHPTVEEVSVRMSDPATQEMLVATYKRGQVSRTRNQRKWLAAEMDADDRSQIAKDYTDSVLNSNKVVFKSRHLREKERRGELSVPDDVVRETLRAFDKSFIEYSETRKRDGVSRRVLLRNNDVARKVRVRGREQDANLCIVVDVDTCCLVTAYWNAANDHHSNLNRSRYQHQGAGNDGNGRNRGKGGKRQDGRRGGQDGGCGGNRRGNRHSGR